MAILATVVPLAATEMIVRFTSYLTTENVFNLTSPGKHGGTPLQPARKLSQLQSKYADTHMSGISCRVSSRNLWALRL